MRIIIADDHPAFVQGLTAWLTEVGHEVIGTARDADGLVQLARTDPPDVAIVDVSMPPGFDDEGLQAAELLAAVLPEMGVLVISAYREARWAARLLRRRSNRVGYLLKHNVTDVDTLDDALERIRRGEVAIDPAIAAELMTQRAVVPALVTLTPRELQVLAHVAEGRSNRGIATILGIEERTVENHVGNVFRKLNLPEGNQRVLAVLELQKGGG